MKRMNTDGDDGGEDGGRRKHEGTKTRRVTKRHEEIVV
jgi:hypothetical protein